ncbi:hypothetical protein KSU19_07280 [Enterobacter quasiroggenkampii]|uniref:hypothetical protein n=1 Tax=Enterobacter quasiroggenkampii TaxID=2497436 RepID=UPI0021D1A6F9|nr:hypothetical protein [Enterobacter quasiroggenkampii]MCU6327448.1 hypothetical protein [Enterobacter quasiroggenkampii]
MVIRLDTPELALNDEELIERIVQERQRGIHRNYFNRIKAPWKSRVALYSHARGNPEIVSTWMEMNDPNVHDRFKNLFLSAKPYSVQKGILEELRNRELDYCPACGEDGTPNTLDHYLPKDDYPEFSVTIINLFPMCDICQSKKSNKTKDELGRRLFIHPYFDSFTEQQVLILNITAPFNAPTSISLMPNPEIPAPESNLIIRHINGLALPERYYRYFKANYIRLLRLVRSIRAQGRDVRNQLEQFRASCLLKSINSWGYIFYDGVLRNEELMEYLISGDIPSV